MKMELISKLKKLDNDHLESLVKFIAELPGSNSEGHENGTVKIQFENFDGQCWQ